MILKIKRFQTTNNSTIGFVYTIDGDNIDFVGYSLELRWRNNERRRSCIPLGSYELIKSTSPKFGDVYRVKDVPNRDGILIHPANTHSELLGCIAIGSEVILTLNEPKVLSTKKTISNLLTLNLNQLIIE